MLSRLFTLVLLSIITLSACAPVNSGPKITDEEAFEEAQYQQYLVVQDYKKDLNLLMPIGHRLLRANAELCGNERTTYDFGFYTDISQLLSNQYRPMAGLNAASKFKAPIQVVYVTPGTSAYGKIKEQDKILAVNDEELNDTPSKNLKKMIKVIDQYQKDHPDKAVDFLIERQGKEKTVSVKYDHLCHYPVYLNVKGASGGNADNNAVADGERIFVSQGIMNVADRDKNKIALITGHELAHNTMLHIAKKSSNAAVGVLLGTTIGVFTGVDMSGMLGNLGAGMHSQSFEAEADYFGTYYAARAGYNISNVHDVWRKMATKNPGSIHLAGTSHPSSAKRFLAIRQTVEEIKQKQQKGEKLIPDGQISYNEDESPKPTTGLNE